MRARIDSFLMEYLENFLSRSLIYADQHTYIYTYLHLKEDSPRGK